jgi:hypothetical protein
LDIVGKIAHNGPRNESEAGSAEPLRLRYENAPDIRTTPAVHFVYNRIEGEDEKRTHTVALDDYDYFMQRLEASAEEAVVESFDA